MAITGILTGLIPLLTKGAESLIANKKEKEQKAFELEKIRLNAEIAADMEAAKAQAEVQKAQAEVAKAEAETERERIKAIKALNTAPQGYKWIEAAISLVRALFGYSAVLIFIASAVNLWQSGSPLLTQAEFAETFSAVLFYYFAERSAKKAFGK
ncbi:MAG: hypothetical protein J5706_04565 [Elusimicrobiales bacterium]|nr:hypothetical protein [Elusimicrobiales bacterium]